MSDCGCDEILNNCSETPVVITTPTCTTTATCREYTWTKCVKYEGANIGCAATVGGVSTFTHIGEAFDFGNVTVNNLVATGGNGAGAIFSVSWTTLDLTYSVTVTTAGTGYVVGDVLTIPGTSLSGVSPANDVTITVSTLSTPVDGVNYQIFNEQTLTEIITNFNDRLCELTPSGADYSAFDYACLRVGGALTGTGTSITTVSQFAEAASQALCDLDGRIDDLEVPGTIIACIPTLNGTEPLSEVLTEIGTKLCAISGAADPITVTVDCFTTAPGSSDPLSDWFQWVVDNTCTIRTALLASISTQTTRINNINTFLHGSTTPSYPITYDITCLGGSATANLDAVADALITEVCSLSTTVGALPDLTAIVLPWATCFSAAPYSYSSAAQSLQTQLERLLNVVSREKVTTYSADFTVTDSACGKTVSLAAGVGVFTCSDLNSCSLHDIGDVQSTLPGAGDTGKTVKWNNSASEYQLIALDSFTNIGVVNKGGSYAAAPIGFYFEAPSVTAPAQKAYSAGFVERQWTVPASVNANYTSTIYTKVTWDGHIYFKGILSSVAVPSVTGLNVTTGTPLFTLPSTHYPTADARFEVNIVYVSNDPTENPLPIPGYVTVSSVSGAVVFYCNASALAGVQTRIVTDLNNANYTHGFYFTGKAIYQ